MRALHTRCLRIAGVLLALLSAAQARADFAPGVRVFAIADPQRPLRGHVWYPAMADGVEDVLIDAKVWEPVTGYSNAAPEPGPFPLVVISHGLYGTSFDQAWLARALAMRGYVVALPNHPGTSAFDRHPVEGARLLARSRDLSRVIDALTGDAAADPAIDGDRIAAIGHALGGFSVMALSGAEVDLDRLARFCAGADSDRSCRAAARLGVLDNPAAGSGSAGDPRVRAIVPLDLDLARAFVPDSLGAVTVPVLVFGAGRAERPDPSVESRTLAAALPAETTRHVEPDAGHFDYLGVCRPEGFEILARLEPGEENACEDAGDRRRALHADVVAAIVAFLTANGVAP